jgi:plasmid stabilization system protein ParE
MGRREIKVRPVAAESIASIALYIESKGMVATAEKFTDAVYDYIFRLADDRKSYNTCKEPSRALLGYKCVPYKKKYTVVFIEAEDEIIICEFISSKLIYW